MTEILEYLEWWNIGMMRHSPTDVTIIPCRVFGESINAKSRLKNIFYRHCEGGTTDPMKYGFRLLAESNLSATMKRLLSRQRQDSQ